MKIEQIVSGPFETNGYLLSDTAGNSVIIDAPLESTNLFMKAVHKSHLKVQAIILTHTHWDHTADAAELRRQTGAKIYVHRDDKYRIIEPNKFTVMRLPFDLEECEPDVQLLGGEKLSFGEIELQVIHTPGHTEGGICIYNKITNSLFAGDTLFCSSVGRCDLPGGSMPQLISSINDKLMILPDETTVYSGHGEQTTIGNERDSNPFLRL